MPWIVLVLMACNCGGATENSVENSDFEIPTIDYAGNAKGWGRTDAEVRFFFDKMDKYAGNYSLAVEGIPNKKSVGIVSTSLLKAVKDKTYVFGGWCKEEIKDGTAWIQVREVNENSRSIQYNKLQVRSKNKWSYFEKLFVPAEGTVQFQVYLVTDNLDGTVRYDNVFVREATIQELNRHKEELDSHKEAIGKVFEDFDSDELELPSYWGFRVAGARGHAKKTDTEKLSGKYSIAVERLFGDGVAELTRSSIEVLPNTEYELKSYTKINNVSGGYAIYKIEGLKEAVESPKLWLSHNWKPVVLRFKTDDSTKSLSVSLSLFGGDIKVWIDDFQLYKVEELKVKSMLPGGDFEHFSPDMFPGWVIDAVDNVKLQQNDSNVYEGKYSGEVVLSGPASSFETHQTVYDFLPGNDYVFSFYFLDKSAGTAKGIQKVSFLGSFGNLLSSQSLKIIPSPVWNQQKLAFNIPDDCVEVITKITVEGGEGSVCFDAAELRPVTQSDDMEYPSFKVERKPTWKAFWIWYKEEKSAEQVTRFFKRQINLDELPKGAKVISNAYGNFEIKVNGKVAYTRGPKGAFDPRMSPVFDIVDLLKKGENTIEAQVQGGPDYPCFILEATLLMQSGHDIRLITDEKWLSVKSATDSQWADSKILGRSNEIPAGDWRSYQWIGRKDEIKILDVNFPGLVDKPHRLNCKIKLLPEQPLSNNRQIKFEISQGKIPYHQQILANQETKSWSGGQPIELNVEVPLDKFFDFLPNGEYEISLDIPRVEFVNGPNGVIHRFTVNKAVETARNELPECKIVTVGDGKAFSINGEIHSPLFAQAYGLVNPDYVRSFSDSGYHIFKHAMFMNSVWVGENRYDFSSIDKAFKSYLAYDPEAYFIPNFYFLGKGYPVWWCDAHPEEMAKYYDGRIKSRFRDIISPDFASQAYKRDVIELITKTIEHMKGESYGERVIGITINGEPFWTNGKELDEAFFGYSESNIKQFKGWVKEKLTKEQIKSIWNLAKDANSEDVNDDICIPTPSQRLAGHKGIFRDPEISRSTIVFNDYMSWIKHNFTEDIAKGIKEYTNGNLLCSCYQGYFLVMGHNAPSGYMQGWSSGQEVVKSDYIDFIHSPIHYYYRDIGQSSAFMSPIDTVAFNGGLYVVENDMRTFLGNKDSYYLRNSKFTTEVMKRDFSMIFSHNAGMYWYDWGAWYDNKALKQILKKCKQIYDDNLRVDRKRISEVAVFVDETSPYYLRYDDKMSGIFGAMASKMAGTFFRTGAPVDWYELKDLARSDFPDYKCYIFLGTIHVDKGMREVIKQKIYNNGKTVLWTYGAGFCDDETASVANMSDLMGFQIKEIDKRIPLFIEMDSNNPYIQENIVLGCEEPGEPVFTSEKDSLVTVYGHYENTNYPAFFEKTYNGTKVIYFGSGLMSPELLRNIFRKAGVHIYIDTSDAIYVNNSFVGIHRCGPSETINISLAEPKKVYDALSGEKLKQIDGKTFSVYLDSGETGMYLLK